MRRWFAMGLWLGVYQLAGLATAAVIYVDFGNSSYPGGGPATYVDGNGRTWNNAVNSAQGASLNNLRNTAGGLTSVGLYNDEGLGVNGGVGAGGLASPNPTYLGSFAVESATLDYWYVSDAADPTGRDLLITGLNAGSYYNLSFFGTRAININRATTYSATGGNGTYSVNLQTSGAGVGADGYNGNNNNIVRITQVTPDAQNRIRININSLAGDLGYIGILGIEEAVPEPSTAMFLLIGGALARYTRRSIRRTQAG